MSNRTTELEGMVDKLTAENVEAAKNVLTLTKERDDVKASCAGFEKAIAELNAKLEADAKSAADVLNSEMKARIAVQDELAKVKAELDSAQAKLANPAFLQAAVTGQAAANEGGSESSETMTFEQAHEQYKKINDPKLRAQFRADHAVELRLV